MLTMRDLEKLTGTTRDGINNLFRRGYLKTPIPETSQGVTRQFTRENGLELGFFVSLFRWNVAPDIATAMAGAFLKMALHGDLPDYWRISPADLTQGRSVNLIGNPHDGHDSIAIVAAQAADDDEDSDWSDSVAGDREMRQSGFIVIDLHSIVDAVDRLASRTGKAG